MAQQKTNSTRKRSAVEDEPDLPPVRGKIVVPKKRVVRGAKPKPKAPARKPVVAKKRRPQPRNRARSSDDQIDDMEEMGGQHVPGFDADGEVEVLGLRQNSRRQSELEVQLAARLSKRPVFPFPPELTDELKPYWIELVNSFPKDHFQVSDTTLMKMYCQCAYDIERQNLLIREEGEVIMGARAPITNPRCKVRESNRATLLALTTKFRNQPASRVNSEGFKDRRGKAQAAAQGAQAVADDGDGLLAGGDGGNGAMEFDEDDIPPTRH